MSNECRKKTLLFYFHIKLFTVLKKNNNASFKVFALCFDIHNEVEVGNTFFILSDSYIRNVIIYYKFDMFEYL